MLYEHQADSYVIKILVLGFGTFRIKVSEVEAVGRAVN